MKNTAEALQIEMIRARRYGRPLSLISIDHESAAGASPAPKVFEDQFEKKLRAAVFEVLRAPDFWGDIEGYSFIVALPETDLIGAAGAANRLANAEIFKNLLGHSPSLDGLALGAAEFSEEISCIDKFVQAARANPIWRSETPSEPTPPPHHAVAGLGL